MKLYAERRCSLCSQIHPGSERRGDGWECYGDGGMRREVTVDYEAATKATKQAALDNLGWRLIAEQTVDAALGLEDE